MNYYNSVAIIRFRLILIFLTFWLSQSLPLYFPFVPMLFCVRNIILHQNLNSMYRYTQFIQKSTHKWQVNVISQTCWEVHAWQESDCNFSVFVVLLSSSIFFFYKIHSDLSFEIFFRTSDIRYCSIYMSIPFKRAQI